MGIIANLIQEGEEVVANLFHSAQTRDDFAQHLADLVNEVIALGKRVEALEPAKPAEPTPESTEAPAA